MMMASHVMWYVSLLMYLLCSDTCASNTPEITFKVSEDERIGTIVGTLSTQRLTGDLTYRLLTSGRQIYVGRKTGKISLGQPFDRDNLCPGKTKCLRQFQVQIDNKMGESIMMTFSIEITDVNDNSPKFPEGTFHLDIAESSTIGNTFDLQKAIDEDGPFNSVVNYTVNIVDNTGDFFRLDVVPGDEQAVIKPVLRQTAKLDREKQKSFQFYLKAMDSGGKIGEQHVKIDITDINDNYPQWKQLPYVVNISECLQPNTPILSIHAVDADEGIYGEVKYKISNLASKTLTDLFHISGEKLFLSGNLNVDKHKRLVLPVKAVDGMGLSTSTNIVLNVKDCNNHDPDIKILSYKGGSHSARIHENNKKKVWLATVKVYDADHNENGHVECHVNDAHRFELEQQPVISPNKFWYFFYKRSGIHFDREIGDRISVRITCNDFGDRRRESSEDVVVQVLDENDNRPHFPPRLYFRVKEHSRINNELGSVGARDSDSGVNRELDYQIMQPIMRTHFEVTSDGKLFARSQFDRETREFYNFTVRATDRGKSPLSADANVTVQVTDINDFAPEYVGRREFYVEEGTYILPFILGHLNATDADAGNNKRLSYKIDRRTNDHTSASRHTSGNYGLQSSNGVMKLTVTGTLDRETNPVHHISLVVKDHGSPKLSTSVTLTIHLQDKNDNLPKFLFPSHRKPTIKMPRDKTVGSTVCEIKATDADQGENGSVVYSLIKTPFEYFKLQEDGVLILAKSLPPSFDKVLKKPSANRYSLVVKATDRGRPPKYATQTLNVLIVEPTLPNKGLRPLNDRPGNGRTGGPGNVGGFLDDRENNLTLLLCLAATVVVVFIMALIAFGYVYLRGEHIFSCWAFNSDHERRNSDEDGAGTAKKIRHPDGPSSCGGTFSDGKCGPGASLLKSKQFQLMDTRRFCDGDRLPSTLYTARLDGNDHGGTLLSYQTKFSRSAVDDPGTYYRELVPTRERDPSFDREDTDSETHKDNNNDMGTLKSSLKKPTNQPGSYASTLRFATPTHRSLSSNTACRVQVLDKARQGRLYETTTPSGGCLESGENVYRLLDCKVSSNGGGMEEGRTATIVPHNLYDTYSTAARDGQPARECILPKSATNTPILSRTPKVTSSFV